MRVMVIGRATKASEAGELPTDAEMQAMGAYGQALVEAGVLVSAEGLHSSSRAKRVRCDGKTRTVVDGPFIESKELIAGFMIWQVASMEEAIAWVRRAPLRAGEEVELRPIMGGEEHLEREEAARQAAGAGKAGA